MKTKTGAQPQWRSIGASLKRGEDIPCYRTTCDTDFLVWGLAQLLSLSMSCTTRRLAQLARARSTIDLMILGKAAKQSCGLRLLHNTKLHADALAGPPAA